MTRHKSRKCRQPRSLAAPRGRHALYHLSLAKYWAETETPQQVPSIMYLACAMCIVQTLTVQRCREVGSWYTRMPSIESSGASIINDKIKIETLETHKSRCLVLLISDLCFGGVLPLVSSVWCGVWLSAELSCFQLSNQAEYSVEYSPRHAGHHTVILHHTTDTAPSQPDAFYCKPEYLVIQWVLLYQWSATCKYKPNSWWKLQNIFESTEREYKFGHSFEYRICYVLNRRICQ